MDVINVVIGSRDSPQAAGQKSEVAELMDGVKVKGVEAADRLQWRLSEAVDGFNGNYQPTYDTQEEIFIQILQDLEEANAELDNTQPTMQGDVLFFGDILKWRKAINSFRLRVLMSLSGRYFFVFFFFFSDKF